MSTSAPPPPPSARKRTLRPWYLVAAMILAWLIGVQGLSEAFATLVYLREGNLPDVATLTSSMKDAAEPIEALMALQEAARLRTLGEMGYLAFPLFAGRFLLSVLLVIASGMAMSGRPGARALAIQALLANAALATLTFWLLRDARYAWVDAVVRVRDVLPALPETTPADQREAWPLLLDRRLWLWLPRVRLILFDVGALVLATITLTSPRTKAFFEAVAAAQEQTEDS
ncbi:hypothetical protein [Polyangium jinanense]|uniref:Uncharacterized protein n=1 Tax=Polyangium jinanense TaxID=2829994 RepID=A0A9X4AQD9_9BACT|nr:hypothetical protein [Polyangium jinanense]MDC3954690.1 hypothetical protein [Polyangium jinanense]MDC3980993.1 hypothetical protein [Polyangium jinanense]